MIDSSLREERIAKEAADPETALVLLDVVLVMGLTRTLRGPCRERGRAKAQVAGREGISRHCIHHRH